VDFQDFIGLQIGFGTTSGAETSDGDLDGDGDVDFQDFLVLQLNFGADTPDAGVSPSADLASAAVPEPSSLALALVAITALVGRSLVEQWKRVTPG
jgi:hypothetical protein